MNQNDINLRPSFHITGGNGWINDPNGLIFYNGLYHVFFQYYPHDIKWGPMHWGHVTSKDLIHWDRKPIALFPKNDTNEDGCFSGTSVVRNNTLFLVYTGFFENGGGENIRQLQCLASSSDGVYFQKHGIIIGENNLPEEFSPCDFRDPKVWIENDNVYMLVAARKKEGKGHILLYKAMKSMLEWEYLGDILDEESLGIMIECPDYVKNLDLLLYSEQFQPNEGYTHLNIHSCRYAYGNLDLENAKFKVLNKGIVDYGFDFYAPQTFADENIMIGWLNMWDRNNPSEKYGFAGSLTIPRRISMVDGKLIQSPVWNYDNQVSRKIVKKHTDKFKLGAVKLEIKGLKKLEIKLRKKEDQFFKVSLEDNTIIFDRSQAGEKIVGIEKDNDSLNGIRRMPIENLDDVCIEIISDEFSLEFFINGLSASFLLYPDIDSEDLEIKIDAKNCVYNKSLFE